MYLWSLDTVGKDGLSVKNKLSQENVFKTANIQHTQEPQPIKADNGNQFVLENFKVFQNILILKLIVDVHPVVNYCEKNIRNLSET